MRTRTLDLLLLTFRLPAIGMIFLTHAATAQYPGYTLVTAVEEFKTKFAAESRTIQSIKSEFVQEKHLSVLEETILSEGHFWFKRENKVRIEYIKPFQYLVVMNGDQMLVRDDNRENRVNTRSSKLFRQINHIIIDCVQGTILENKNFSSRLFQNDRNDLIELTTLDPAMKEFFERIVVLVDRKDNSVSRIELHEPGGDQTILRFNKKELNTPVSDEIFAH